MTRLAIAATMAAAALAVVVGAPLQLAERPLSGALNAMGYYTQPTHDPVTELNSRIADGSAKVRFDEGSGYLRSTLDALHVPVESQMLVMSKTGIQGLHTTPDNPRAIYFSDAVTIGYIRNAPLLELAVHDPTQGVVFYTIDQKPQTTPVFERRKDCLTCHQGFSTLHVPGMIARSSYVTREGLTMGQFGTYDFDDRTLFRQRFGGWYVTGTHGSMRHLGNAIVTNAERRDEAISDKTLNRTSLEGFFDPHGYPSAHSDIAALMVFQHQVRMTNLITRIGWETRLAAATASVDMTRSPLRDGVNELVDYLLFVDEQPLTDTITGTSGFAEKFSAQGPADRQGRSLHQLDLQRRLQKFPCSYMIYSPAFAALPAETRTAIYARIWAILSGRETDPKYARLSDADRRAVVDILRETLPDAASVFRSS